MAFPPMPPKTISPEAKQAVLEEVLQMLSSVVGDKLQGMKNPPPDAPEGSPAEEAAEPPDEAAAEGDMADDEDAKKLRMLAGMK